MVKSVLGYALFVVACGGIFVAPIVVLAHQALEREERYEEVLLRQQTRYQKCMKDLLGFQGDTAYFCREYAQK